MNTHEIVRYWKDEDYFLGLNEAERALLPENPSGLIHLTDEELNGIEVGTGTPLSIAITVFSYLSYEYCSYPICPSDYPICNMEV